jgi:hypothetical protein
MSAGNITATAAMGARIEAEGRYEEYMAAEDPAEFYDSYLTAYKAYTASIGYPTVYGPEAGS